MLTLNETAPTNTAIRSLQHVMACDVKGRKRMRIRAPTARIADWNDMLQKYTHIHSWLAVPPGACTARKYRYFGHTVNALRLVTCSYITSYDQHAIFSWIAQLTRVCMLSWVTTSRVHSVRGRARASRRGAAVNVEQKCCCDDDETMWM